MNRTTSTIKGPNNEVAVTMHDKEALIRVHAFSIPSAFQGNKYLPGPGSAHLLVNLQTLTKALFCQSVKKVPGAIIMPWPVLQLTGHL